MSSSHPSDFRRHGQRRAQGRRLEDMSSDVGADRLLHELQVHQIELEMQNEELRQVRSDIQSALQRYTELYDNAPVGYFSLDQFGTIRQLNLAGARLLGAEPSQLVGRTFRHFIAPEDRPAFGAFLGRVLAGHSEERCELTVIGSDPPRPPLVAQIEAAGDRSGDGFSMVAVDITDKKRANAELLRSNLELQQFAYIAAHDLQTPLRSISSFAQLLQKDYGGRLGPEADEWIDRMAHGVHRMQALIQDLLDYSRVDSRGRPFEATDFNQIFDEVVASSEAAIRESGATITRDQLPTVTGDRIQLAQVLQNLIGNAIKYRSQQPPRVHVSARRVTQGWVFSVADNGIGIDRKHHDEIFEIFRRLHSQQAYAGTGIGLAICQRVMQRHGGRIWVDSEPGKGSVFHFLLPDRHEED